MHAVMKETISVSTLAMLRVLIVIVFVSFANFAVGQLAIRTFGDVQRCVAGNYSYCRDYCQRLHPSTTDFERIQNCFDQRLRGIQDCLKDNGFYVDDSTPCFAATDNTNRVIAKDMPNAARCFKRCLFRVRRLCKRDCTGTSPEGRESKLTECKKDDSVLDCMESESQSPSGPQTPSNPQSPQVQMRSAWVPPRYPNSHN